MFSSILLSLLMAIYTCICKMYKSAVMRLILVPVVKYRWNYKVSLSSFYYKTDKPETYTNVHDVGWIYIKKHL